jgi:hypothetical protein
MSELRLPPRRAKSGPLRACKTQSRFRPVSDVFAPIACGGKNDAERNEVQGQGAMPNDHHR